MLELSGSLTVEIRKRDGLVIDYSHPVRTSIAKGNLTIAGGNRPETVFRLSDVSSATVVEYDRGMTTALISGIGAVVALIVLIPVLSMR